MIHGRWPVPKHTTFAVLLLSTALALLGCTTSTEGGQPTGTDLWAAEPIDDVREAKRVTVEILTELAGLAPREHLLPEESQPQRQPGERPQRLMACGGANTFQYPGMMGLMFRDGTSAQAFEDAVHAHLRQQEGWTEGSSPDGDGGRNPKFMSASGFAVAASYNEYRGKHGVVIYVFSPCFEMPDDFQQSVDEF